MIAYILSSEDLSIRDILNFDKYDFVDNIDYNGKSYIVVPKKPVIDSSDFVWCKDGNDTVFIGICDTYSTEAEDQGYTINLLQKECLFDRQIFLENESLKSSNGIEDFIARAIKDNWIQSGDSVMDVSYLTVKALTHTTSSASVSSEITMENGVYNLKTYMGNCKELYQIYTRFTFSSGALRVFLYCSTDGTLPIDIQVSDIADYAETYEIDTLARLLVHWKVPDVINEDGTITVGAVTNAAYYLRNNRTITADPDDPDRINGTSQSVYIEAESQYDMQQQAYNYFAGNRYHHSVSFQLSKNSRIYNISDYYVGRICTFRSKTGTQETIITETHESSDSNLIDVTFGKLKITLIQKLRRFYV